MKEKVSGCKDCGEANLATWTSKAGVMQFRTRCRLCWNRYCAKFREGDGYKGKFRSYMREYCKEYRKVNKSYRERNNKANKKAIAELKDSYVKNRLFKCKKAFPVSDELIEVQRQLLKLKRVLR